MKKIYSLFLLIFLAGTICSISCADENIQSLTIYNSIGIIQEIKGDDKKEMNLNLKDLMPGIYFIRINLEDEFYLEKIILLE